MCTKIPFSLYFHCFCRGVSYTRSTPPDEMGTQAEQNNHTFCSDLLLLIRGDTRRQKQRQRLKIKAYKISRRAHALSPVGMAWDLVVVAVKVPPDGNMTMCPSSKHWASPVYNICTLQQAVAVLVLHVICGCGWYQHCGLTSHLVNLVEVAVVAEYIKDLVTVTSFVLMALATGKC